MDGRRSGAGNRIGEQDPAYRLAHPHPVAARSPGPGNQARGEMPGQSVTFKEGPQGDLQSASDPTCQAIIDPGKPGGF